MTTITTQHSEIIRLVSNDSGCNTEGQPKEEIFIFKPISIVEELSLFDKKLNDDSFMAKMTSHLGKICGTTGKRNGWDVSYKLIDHYITSEVMQLCQWTKCDGKDKPALIMFNNIQQCFFNAVLLADTNYTFNDSQKFLGVVCKNSKRRLEEKLSKIDDGEYTKKPKVVKHRSKTDSIVLQNNLAQKSQKSDNILNHLTGDICDANNRSDVEMDNMPNIDLDNENN